MSEIDVSFDSLEMASELAELCRARGIGREWIARSRTVDELVACVLDQCEKKLSTASAGRGTDEVEKLRQVQDLLGFAQKAMVVRARTESAPRLVCGVEDLERIRAGSAGADALEAGERTAELLAEIGGLCHQINNPLTSLMGRVQILRMKPGSDAAAVERALTVIEESARRVALHVQELGHLVGRERERVLVRS